MLYTQEDFGLLFLLHLTLRLLLYYIPFNTTVPDPIDIYFPSCSIHAIATTYRTEMRHHSSSHLNCWPLFEAANMYLISVVVINVAE